MDLPAVLTTENEPWWAKHRDKAFILAFMLMFLMLVGLVPSPVSKGVEQLILEHNQIANILQVQCVHQAKDTREQTECITGRFRLGD